MSPYLTFKIISVAILLVVMVVVLISKKSDKATVKESDDKQKTLMLLRSKSITKSGIFPTLPRQFFLMILSLLT